MTVATELSARPSIVSGSFGSLFSGIGGLDLGLERAGWDCRWQVEVNPWCQAVLAKHWPDVPRFGDVKEIDPHELERVSLVAGGFPCQPVSYAGNRLAQADERWLWPDFAAVLRVVRPEWVLVENVPGLLTAGLGDVLGDLHALGFDAEWSVVPACSVGAPHPRARVFVVAHAEGDDGTGDVPRSGDGLQGWRAVFGGGGRQAGSEWWLSEPALDRVAVGVPSRVVRPQLTGLGNAVVPQVAEFVGRMILEAA